VLLGGVPIEDRLVLRLARAVDDSGLAGKLTMAYTLRSQVVNLTHDERQTILSALQRQPEGLEQLHDQLVEHAAWQLRQRL
jgi:hypothetical protein